MPGMCRFRENYWHDTIGHEFFINLTPDSSGPGVTRHELMDLTNAEDAEAWMSLIGNLVRREPNA